MSILNFRLNKRPFALESNQGDENGVISDDLCRTDQLGYHLMLLVEKKSCIYCHKPYLNHLCLLPKSKAENILICHLNNYTIQLLLECHRQMIIHPIPEYYQRQRAHNLPKEPSSIG